MKRTEFSIAVLHGNIHITGGLFGPTNSCKVYSPSDDKSTMTSPMNWKRWYHCCCAKNGKIYVCGGKIQTLQFAVKNLKVMKENGGS